MFYGIEVSRAGIAVKLFHIQISYEIPDVGGSAESGLRRPVLVKRRSTALFSEMPLLSCAEYARRRGVSESDVHDWIQRGQLRSAVEENGEWRVPADAKAPDGRFETQTWSLTKRPIPETAVRDYPFLASLSPGQPFQIYEDKSGNYVVAPLEKEKSGSAGQSVAVLSREERERFEFCLLRSDWAAYDDEKYMADSENPLNPINRIHCLLKMFLNAHSRFSRDDLQGYLNLYAFVINPPYEPLEKVEKLINLAFERPQLLRYRE